MKQFVYEYSVIKRVVKSFKVAIDTRDLNSFENNNVFYIVSDSKNDTIKKTVKKLKRLSCPKETREYFVNLLNKTSKYNDDEEYNDSVEFVIDNILYKIRFYVYNTLLDVECSGVNIRGENIADKRLVANSKGTNAYKFAEIACKIDLSNIFDYVKEYVGANYIKSHIHFNDFSEIVFDNNFKIEVDNNTSIEVEAKLSKHINIYEEYEYTQRQASDVVKNIVFNNFDFDYILKSITHKSKVFDLYDESVSGIAVKRFLYYANIADTLKTLENLDVDITDEHLEFIKNVYDIYKAVDDAVKNER